MDSEFEINPKIFKSHSILRPSLSTSWRIELKLVPRQSINEPMIEHDIQNLHPFGSHVAHMIAISCHVYINHGVKKVQFGGTKTKKWSP